MRIPLSRVLDVRSGTAIPIYADTDRHCLPRPSEVVKAVLRTDPQNGDGCRGADTPACPLRGQSTFMTVPPVRRTSSSKVIGNTVCGVPPAAQISG